MHQQIHFIFSGTQHAKGGGTIAWKRLLKNLKTEYKVYLHYSSCAVAIWENFNADNVNHVVHPHWKTYDNKSKKYYDKSYQYFQFDTIADGAKVIFDASECVRQLTDTLHKKKCEIYWHVQSPEHFLRKNIYRMIREFISIQKIKKLIFISDYVRRVFENDLLYKLLSRKIPSSIVYYGISFPEIAIAAEKNYVIYFGRYEWYKHPLFLEKLDTETRYVGGISGCTNPVEVPKNKDLGWMSPDQAATMGDVFVFPSEHEAFGLAVIEMMSYGKIPLCFNSGAFPEIIDHGKNGFLIDPFDSDAASKIIHTLQSNNALRKTISDNARTTAHQFGIPVYQKHFFAEII